MRSRIRRVGTTSKAVVYAIIVHVIVGVLLVVNLDWPTHILSSSAKEQEPPPVQANVVSEAEIQKQMQAIKEEEEAEERKQEEAQEKLEELLQKQKEEEQRLAEIKEQQEAERKKAEELERKKEQERAELEKKEEEQRKREEAEAEKQRQEAERKRKEEEERQRQLAEEKRRKEEEQRRKEEEQRQQELAEKRQREQELQEQLEQERLQAQVDDALAQYVPIIRQKVSRNWNRPASLRNDIEAHVNVRLSQAGEVISARIVKSSGNPVFDRSVENAVLKASPLPIPQERGINDQFRNLTLRFRPEDMLS